MQSISHILAATFVSERRRVAGVIPPRAVPRGLAIALLVMVTCPAIAAPVAHAAGAAYVLTRKNGPAKERITVASQGYAHRLFTRGRLTSGMAIDYRKRDVVIYDAAGKRFQRISLRAAVERVASERRMLRKADTPYFELPNRLAFPSERPQRLVAARRIKGVRARGYLLRRAGQPASRLWLATGLPRPPAGIRRLLARIPFDAGSALTGRVALRVDERRRGRYRVVTAVGRVRRTSTGRLAFAAPKGFKPTTELVAPITRQTSSVPAHVTRQIPWFPIQDNPEVFVVYWGRRFSSEPGTIQRINQALANTILKPPYIDGMAQYGVGPGRLLGHIVVPSDPPASAGRRDAEGWAANAGMASFARASGAPFAWTRIGPDPLVVIFVSAEVVDASDNNGYHSVMPVQTTLLDPLGIFLQPVYPFAMVKVPPFDASFSHIDGATVTASHETVETATDPVTIPAGWVDPSKGASTPPEQGEIADICQEGMTAPWFQRSRVNGIAVNTYWSENTRSCVPESRPSIRIDSPINGSSASRGQVIPLRATASDPFDALMGPSVTWASDIQGDLGSGTLVNATLQPGAHLITATATNSQALVRTASVRVTVISRPPQVAITDPPSAATFPSDRLISFHGTATDPADGELTGSRLVWRDNGAQFGTGRDVVHNIPQQGSHTITLTATNNHGESATDSIAITVGPPTGGPSAVIDSPSEGAWFQFGETQPVSFTGHASDPEDGTLSGASLRWFDDYDVGNSHFHVHFGSGTSASTLLYSGGTERQHTISLVATDSDGKTDTDVIHVSSGQIG